MTERERREWRRRSEDRILDLINTTPVSEVPLRRRLWRYVAVGAVVVSYVAFAMAGYAGLQSRALSECTNHNVIAMKHWLVALNEVFSARAGSPAEKTAVVDLQVESEHLAAHWKTC